MAHLAAQQGPNPLMITTGQTKTTMDRLEMLTAREQLMEDIDCIISDYFQGIDDAELNEVIGILCDAVCKNFPTN